MPNTSTTTVGRFQPRQAATYTCANRTCPHPPQKIHPPAHLWWGTRYPSIHYAESVDDRGQSGADNGPIRPELVELSAIKPHAMASSG